MDRRRRTGRGRPVPLEARSRDGARNPRGRRDSGRRSRRRWRRRVPGLSARAGRRSRRARRSRGLAVIAELMEEADEQGGGLSGAGAGAARRPRRSSDTGCRTRTGTRSRAARRDLQHAARVPCRHQLRPRLHDSLDLPPAQTVRGLRWVRLDPGRSAAPGGFRERDDLEPGIAASTSRGARATRCPWIR